MRTYLTVYLGSALITVLITPLVIRLAHHINATDYPRVRTVHSKPIPRIGGLAIFLSSICLVLLTMFLPHTIGEALRDSLSKIVVLLSAAGFIFFVGLVDDIITLRARVKFLAELIAALAVCAVGAQIKSVVIADWLILDFGWFSWPLTVLWIVGITNAINLSDGLDGLAAGISAIACGVIAILAIYNGQVAMAVLELALLGSLTGFLFFNSNPAKIFMGDCGSLFLGFVISTSSVMCSEKSGALVGLALPFLALGIPIFDTLFSMLRRFAQRRSLFAPDRSHLHHRLLDMGLCQRHVVIIAYAVTLLAAGLGLFMMGTSDLVTVLIFGCILLLLLLVFYLAGSVSLRETAMCLRKKNAINRQLNKETKSFEDVQLHFRRTTTFDDWWQVVCLAAERLDFVKLKLVLENCNNTSDTLIWPRTGTQVNLSKIMTANIPIGIPPCGPQDASRWNPHDMNEQLLLNFEVTVSINGSLESATHRMALFCRLIQECNYPKIGFRV